MLKEYKNWSGSRKELVKILSIIEDQNPKDFMMISNKSNKYLKVTPRRIQNFLDEDILTKAPMVKGEYIYNSEHLYRYLAAIKLKNLGHSLRQISNLLSNYEIEEVKDNFLRDKIIKENKKNLLRNIDANEDNLSSKLKSLGRLEGRVLRSQWIKFAVTKWCHLDVKKKEFQNLKKDDVDIIVDSIRDILNQTMVVKDIDKKIG